MMDQSDSDILDYHVKKSNVQSLSSREAVCAFFSHIGYNTEARITQKPANLGITADSVARQIKYIERVANQDNYFRVYLFEVDSVTISLTRSLARYFRDLSGLFLFVITSDYERIDFVLAEVYISTSNSEPRGLHPTRKPPVRPRILTVERRKPTRVQLRVLNRFPYTEPDPYAQYDKLLSAYDVADWSEEFFNNRALFSDYYLKERLKDTDEWNEDPRPAYDTLQRIFSSDGSVLPVLKSLGFSTVEVDRQKKLEEPNYRLYMQDDDSKPVTVALTYPWNRSLDGSDETRDPDTYDENPGKVVVSILEEGETDWAIVTNGKIWRLYSRKTHSRATNYYEIDLEEVLANRYDSPEKSFRYFWLLFRAKAFQSFETVHEGEKRTSTFLDTLLEGSRDYAKELGERLKERVFNEIVPHFASGFIQYIRDTEGSQADLSRERLDDIFHGTLALLYRLLFLLYAESRDLLPVKEIRGYYEISLRKLTQEINDAAGDIQDEASGKLQKAYRSDSTELYDRLTELFRVIDEGDTRINVPCYNGSLFITDPGDGYTSEAENARFLANHRIPDRHLALGLDLMARDLDDKLLSLVFIDYKSLGVRQLGSIYEGLLEFRLEIADQKLGIMKRKKKEVYVPFRELTERQQARIERQGQVVRKGHVYLSNDKSERKATGSYYTPDYIVRYIVENTVGPVLEEKFDNMRPEFRKAEKDHRDAVNRQKKFQEKGMKGSDPEKVANTYLPVVNELFDLSILDPAMGSGHFLVEAVDFVTDKMITFLNAFPWNPVVAMLRETRETILESMSKQEITIDINRLTDVNLLKRHVLKRCVYGVDLNPMAVELAKVSLWLDCFTLGAPLSFLDHHLKCGNSLIGSRIEAVREEVESDLFGTQFAGLITATAGLIHVGELSDVTVTQVKESAQAFRDASSVLEPFKEVLDFWTAQYFCDRSEANEIRNVFLSGRFPQIKRGWHRELGSAQSLAFRSSEIADEKRFFHWELEFPEVFFGTRRGTTQAIAEKENPGFDAVIGNPPYVNLDKIDSQYSIYLKKAFPLVWMGQSDILYFFVNQGIRLLRHTGRLGKIVSRYFMEARFANGLRKLILEQTAIKQIYDFGNLEVFHNVGIDVAICVFEKGGAEPAEDNNIQVVQIREMEHLSQILAEHIMLLEEPTIVPQSSLNDQPWSFVSGNLRQIIHRVDSGKCFFLGERFIVGMGMQTGANDVFSISLDDIRHYKLDRSMYKKVISNSDIKKYYIDFKETYWLYLEEISEGQLRSALPTLCEYLEQNDDRLRNRIAFKRGDCLWFRYSYPRFVEHYPRPKLIVPYIANSNRFGIDAKGEYFSSTDSFILCPKKQGTSVEYLGYLASVLNSKLLNFRYKYLGGLKGGGAWSYSKEAMNKLPIRRIDSSDPNEKKQYENLTHLAQEIIDMNEEWRIEQKRFFGWIQDQLHILPDKKGHIGIDALSGKTTIRNYPGNYEKGEEATGFSDILKVLQKNKSRIRANLSDAAFVRNLEREYEKSLEILLPIKDRLAKTDLLIDQIVYKLYGLTEEEIAIVEGRG